MKRIKLFVLLLVPFLSALLAEPKPSNSYPFEKIIVSGEKIILYHLHPKIDKWLVLQKGDQFYHLENPNASNPLTLYSEGIRMVAWRHNKFERIDCKLWRNPQSSSAKNNSASQKTTEEPSTQSEPQVNSIFDSLAFKNTTSPYFALCDGLLYVRFKRSSDTNMSLTEWGTQILRSTAFGENFINQFKPYLVSFEAEQVADSLDTSKEMDQSAGPKAALLNPGPAHKIVLQESNLGITLREEKSEITLGHFYETKFYPEVSVSLFEPGLTQTELANSVKKLIFPLAPNEAEKLVYIAAYNLNNLTANFVLGTDEPPLLNDGAQTDPIRKNLAAIGNVPPYDLAQSVAVFIGGFKKHHGVFLGGKHKGKEYGYVQGGVELKKLSAGVATLVSTIDENVQILAWPENPEEAQNLFDKTVSARQNGVLVVEDGKPTEYIKDWRSGNWAASAEGLRFTLRAGVCIQETEQGRYLLFMAFTQATPSAMAITMSAYSCKVGMHLDMNALMYLHNALFRLQDSGVEVQYLNKEMLYPKSLKLHRYIMDNNYRDFFYVARKRNTSP